MQVGEEGRECFPETFLLQVYEVRQRGEGKRREQPVMIRKMVIYGERKVFGTKKVIFRRSSNFEGLMHREHASAYEILQEP